MKKRVTIQGVNGCFHDAAARAFFAGEDIEVVPCETFNSMFDVLNGDSSLIGIMAIENTIAGSLLQNHELLRQSNLKIVGEYKMRISHVLCALPGQSIDELTEVNSHPMALMQCEQYLLRHPNLKMVEKTDTAGSAEEIAKYVYDELDRTELIKLMNDTRIFNGDVGEYVIDRLLKENSRVRRSVRGKYQFIIED